MGQSTEPPLWPMGIQQHVQSLLHYTFSKQKPPTGWTPSSQTHVDLVSSLLQEMSESS